MKASNYNFLYKRENESALFYNARTNALAVLDPEHIAKYELFLETGTIDDTEFKEALKQGSYIIDKDTDELKLIKMHMLDGRYNGDTLALTIAPTVDCNFRCIYCYEKESIKNSKMSKEIQEALLTFIRERIKTINTLQISWYGGEPLLAFDIIDYLSPIIMELCKENDVLYSASIVTNGYLLTPDICRKLVEYKVTNMQITLDGPQEVHDQRRPLAGGQGTFNKIIKNVSDCIDIMDNIAIRVNTDKENSEEIDRVIAALEGNGISRNKASIYLGYVENHNDVYEVDKCLKLDQFSNINFNFIKDNNINIMNLYPRLSSNFCCADYRHAYIVDSEGYLYKCWNDIGIKEFNIGHIQNVEPESKACLTRYMDYMLYDPTEDEECVECEYLPICMGGCPNKRLRTSSHRCADQKYMFENILKECANHLIEKKKEDNQSA